MDVVLETNGLSKRFGTIQAVDDVALRVEAGDIYGFLGLNGAGKTTTIRMLLHLIYPDAGTVHIFGKELRPHFIEIMSRIGSLVELPAAYPHLSAVTNLDLLRRIHGNVERSRIDEVLEHVGLSDRKNSKVRTYSQGMRQRLGIAAALLSHPDLVILDEPTNGLDPRGIQEIRSLIRSLNQDHGVTFLISSHLLHEIELICNRVGIIRNGRLLLQKPVRELLTETASSVQIECDRIPEALSTLNNLAYVQGAAPRGEGIRAKVGAEHLALLNGELQSAGFAVSEFTPVRMTLEEFFLNNGS